MTEDPVRHALDEGMLERARAAAAREEYDEAIEDILAVLALDPFDVPANVELLRTAESFVKSSRRQLVDLGLPQLADFSGRVPRLDSAFASLADQIRTDSQTVGLNEEEQQALLALARYVVGDKRALVSEQIELVRMIDILLARFRVPVIGVGGRRTSGTNPDPGAGKREPSDDGRKRPPLPKK